MASSNDKVRRDDAMLDSCPPSGRRAIAAIWKVCPLHYNLPFISASFCPSIISQAAFKRNPDMCLFSSTLQCDYIKRVAMCNTGCESQSQV